MIKIECTEIQARRWEAHLSQYHFSGRLSLSESQISKICSLRLKGHTTKEISLLTGFNEKTICKYLK